MQERISQQIGIMCFCLHSNQPLQAACLSPCSLLAVVLTLFCLHVFWLGCGVAGLSGKAEVIEVCEAQCLHEGKQGMTVQLCLGLLWEAPCPLTSFGSTDVVFLLIPL